MGFEQYPNNHENYHTPMEGEGPIVTAFSIVKDAFKHVWEIIQQHSTESMNRK